MIDKTYKFIILFNIIIFPEIKHCVSNQSAMYSCAFFY